MQKEILRHILSQNYTTSLSVLEKVSQEHVDLKLSENSASVGFIYRHVGEIMNWFGLFFGIQTGVQNTTMGFEDIGQGKDVEESKKLVQQGYTMLQELIDRTPDADWLEPVDTPFFGRVSRIQLFSHILFHNSHHAGQVHLTLKRGNKF